MVRNRRNTLKLLIIVLALIIIFPLSISATSDLEQLTPINESTIDDGNIVIADEVYQKQQSESFDQGMFTLFTPTAEEILSTQIIKKNDQEVTQHHRVLDVTTNNNGYAKIGNELIEFAVSQEGRFSVGTTGGNPDNANDNNSKMLYGHPSPGTSYTTIRLDSNNYIYETDDWANNLIDETGNKHTSFMVINNQIKVTQELSLVNNLTTQQVDTVKIKYTAENIDSQSHLIGLRIMMDTMLGSNDAAPFRIAGYGDLTTEKEFSGNSIPQYWQAFDSLTNPTVISSGTLIKSAEGKPNKTQFTNWRNVRGIPWGYIPKEGISNGDSAVSVIWDEVQLAVGQTKSYVTYYGLSSFDTSVLDNYSVSITAPQSLDVSSSENDYEPNPFTVVAYIQNISSSQRNNILVKIVLPSELTLFDNSTQTIEIASLAPNEMKTVSWVIFATAQSSEKTAQYNIQIDDGINVNEVAASITLPQVFQNEIVLEDLGFSRTAGIEYEQTTDLFDTSVKPAIKNVRIAAIDTNIGKYRLEIGPDDFECASYITPFFFWKSKDGSFSEVDSTYQAVTFTADPGTGDNKVSASAYIGDSLGYVEEYKVFVDGSSITSGSEELTCAFISPFSNINGWSTMDIRFNAYLEEDGIIQNGTIIDLYYLDTTHGDQSWEPIVRDMIDKTAYQWMVPNKSLPLTKLKLVACNGGKASIIESSSFSITPTLYVYGKILTINSEPICGTVVNLSNGMQAITDESGSFMFRDVNAGTYTLSAEGGNYVTSSYTVTVNNTNTQVNRIFRQR